MADFATTVVGKALGNRGPETHVRVPVVTDIR